MKKLYFIFLSMFAAFVITGCTSDDVFEELQPKPQEGSGYTLTADIDTEDGQRTVLDNGESGGNKVLWEEGDQIMLVSMDGTKTCTFILKEGAGTTQAKFETQSEFDRTKQYVAYYPASLYDVTEKKLVLPATQTYSIVGGKPKFDIAPMYGALADNTITFKNICAVLRLKLTGTEAVKSITVSSSNKSMSGDIIISGDAAIASEGTAAVTLNCNDTQLDGTTPTSFYVAVPVADYEGLTVSVTNSDYKGYTKIASNTASMSRNNIYPLSFSSAGQHQWVQLWDDGVKWATMNVDASTPTEAGTYFAWGDVEKVYSLSKTTFTFKTSRPATKTRHPQWNANYGWDKYNAPYCESTGQGVGTWGKYTKTGDVLSSDDDAATYQWGKGWRMPKKSDFDDLIAKCYWVWTTSYDGNSVNGYIVYKRLADDTETVFDKSSCSDAYNVSSCAHIFLQAAGFGESKSLKDPGTTGSYWSSTGLYTGTGNVAYRLQITSDTVSVAGAGRYYGRSVRAVSDSK